MFPVGTGTPDGSDAGLLLRAARLLVRAAGLLVRAAGLLVRAAGLLVRDGEADCIARAVPDVLLSVLLHATASTMTTSTAAATTTATRKRRKSICRVPHGLGTSLKTGACRWCRLCWH